VRSIYNQKAWGQGGGRDLGGKVKAQTALVLFRVGGGGICKKWHGVKKMHKKKGGGPKSEIPRERDDIIKRGKLVDYMVRKKIGGRLEKDRLVLSPIGCKGGKAASLRRV